MNREANIARFEAEMSKVQRPGMDKLMNFIRRSDFYTAPASTKYHLSCEGGLLQHSLNVLDALREMLRKENDGKNEDGSPRIKYHYAVAGRFVCTFPEETLILVALLHDVCKTYFYSVSTRNVKNEQTGKWEKAPYYTVMDKMPLGHGPKSAMIVKQYIELTSAEMYAIWWHMGFSDTADTQTLAAALRQYPLLWALHTADVAATYFMEAETGNAALFEETEAAQAEEEADAAEFQEAPAYDAE